MAAIQGGRLVDQTQLRSPDLFGRTQRIDEATLGVVAARLEVRGRHPFFRSAIDEYLAALDLAGTEAVLDLGCGTGVAARAVAARHGLRGPIAAVDISPHLVEAGRRLAREEGVGDRIGFRVGDAHALGLPAGGFDAVAMHTPLSHVAEPAEVLAEGRRLLRPGGGRPVVFDGDLASLTVAADAPDRGQDTDAAVRRRLAANPRVMRAMPRLLAEGGFGLFWSRGYLAADIGRLDVWASSMPGWRALLPKVGAMTEAEANAFIDGLERASAENRFFGGSAF
jgi:ubiquinone/menaquinone biosynthesis C-methylase UbiE